MATYTPSLRDVLARWTDTEIVGVHSEIRSDGGVYGASLTVQTNAVEISLVVTGVAAAEDPGLDEVHKAFTQFIHGPEDAATLAAEVNRLRDEVRRLKEEAAR